MWRLDVKNEKSQKVPKEVIVKGAKMKNQQSKELFHERSMRKSFYQFYLLCIVLTSLSKWCKKELFQNMKYLVYCVSVFAHISSTIYLHSFFG